MTLSEILIAIYRKTDHADAPETAVVNRVQGFVRDRYRRILTKPWARRLLHGEGQFASIANQAEYGFPFGVSRITRMYETTNDYTLKQRSLDWYRMVQPDPAQITGTPEVFVVVDVGPLLRRPQNTGLWIVASGAPNVVQVTIEGLLTDGSQVSRSAALNGITRVQISSGAETFTDVVSVRLDAATTHTIELWDAAAAGNRLTFIVQTKTAARMLRIALWPTPSGPITYFFDLEHQVNTLDFVAGSAEPELIPIDFHDLLVLGGVMDEYEKKNDKRYSVAKTDYTERLKELRSWVYNHSAHAYASSAPPPPSRLGPWFPAGT